jgi:hypothetical protein
MTGMSALRPRDLAVLYLASGDLLPRKRARTQQPDVAGLALKRLVLDRLAALDPEPEQLDATLVHIVNEIGPPTGPTRAIALGFREEWQAACTSPEFLTHLLGEAAHQSREENARGH